MHIFMPDACMQMCQFACMPHACTACMPACMIHACSAGMHSLEGMDKLA